MYFPVGVVAGKGGVTAFSELGEEESLNGDREAGLCAASGLETRNVARATLNGNGTLTSGGHHL